ncbi:MAG: carboxypeptidase-like regulatory domain-containing protein, partial [Planctomycetaceae bacterium]
ALILLGGVVGTSVAGLLMPSVGQEGQQSTSSAAGVEIAQEKSKVSITTGDWATDEQIIQGRVWSGPNTPVPDTKVYWFRSGIEELRSMQPRLVATTGSEGRFSFRMPDYKTRDTDPASWDVRDYFVFTAKGHSYALKNAAGLRAEMTGQYYKAWVGEIADGESIVQLPVATESLRGRIVDIDGQPVAGARITICNQQQVARDNSIPGPPTVDALDAIPFPRNPPQRKTDWHELLSDLFAHIEIVPRRFALPSATTNANGEFELSGVDNLLLLLAVEADGFESTEIIASVVRKAPLHIKADRQQIFRNTTIHANDFSFVMAPSNPVRGRITDLDTGQPIVDVVVRPTYVRRFSRRRTEDFAAITDKDGRYEIRGLPIKKDIEIEAFTTNDVPWVPAGTEVDTTKPGESLKADIGMKKGLWAKGRIYDATDGGPFTGSVQYFWFGGDGMRKQYPGADKVSRASRYHTNVRGEFRIPVMPTYGILTYRWDAADLGARERIDKFTRGLGADSLKRPFYNKKSRTNGFYMTATGSMIPWNFNAVRDFKPEAGAKTVRADIPMRSCKPFHMKVVMADGSKPKLAPVNQGFEASPDEDELYPEFEVHGLVEGWPRDLKKTLEYEITDMADEATRKVFVYHEKEDLAGGAFVSQETPQPALIRLMPAASISGRLVDEDGEPITEAFLYNSVAYNRVADAGLWADHPGRISGPNQIPVDKEGRFRIGGLLQGWTYSASVMTEGRGEQMRRTLGTAFEKITVETGQQLDLGDVKLKPQRR